MSRPDAPAVVRGLDASAFAADLGGAVLFGAAFAGAAFAASVFAVALFAVALFAGAVFAAGAVAVCAFAVTARAGADFFSAKGFDAESCAAVGGPPAAPVAASTEPDSAGAGAADSAAVGALFALRLPKMRDFFLFSFVSTIAGALLVPSAGSRATPPGNVLVQSPTSVGNHKSFASTRFLVRTATRSAVARFTDREAFSGHPSAARLTEAIIARLAANPIPARAIITR